MARIEAWDYQSSILLAVKSTQRLTDTHHAISSNRLAPHRSLARVIISVREGPFSGMVLRLGFTFTKTAEVVASFSELQTVGCHRSATVSLWPHQVAVPTLVACA